MVRQLRRLQLRRSMLRLQTLEDRSVPSSVQGTIFDDANHNQLFDSGESGLAGWIVFVDNNNDTTLNLGETSAVSDANGNYLLDTTSIPPNSNGWDIFSLDLQVGSGGRWMCSTARTVSAHPINEPAAVRNFGVQFESYVSVEPDGPETLVNVTTANGQGCPAVASDAAGNYVVAWNEWDHAVRARVFNADGSPRSGEVTVTTVGNLPTVAMADNGRFVVAWGDGAVYARAYNADATTATGIISVAASKNTSNQIGDVAMDAVGNFAVLYDTTKSGPQGLQHVVQRYTAAGATIGNGIKVASTYFWSGAKEGIAMDGTGKFVVVWDHGDANGVFVFAQRYSASGQAVGSRITVATGMNPATWQSDVSMNAAGRFAVTWWDYGANSQVKAQVYDWGTPVGGNITFGPKSGGVPTSDVDAANNVTFAWSQDGEVAFQRLTGGGVLEPVLLANTTTQGKQSHTDYHLWHSISLAATRTDRFVVAWQGNGPGDDQGVFAQRFAIPAAPRPLFDGSPTAPSVGMPPAKSVNLFVDDDDDRSEVSLLPAHWWGVQIV